MKIRAIIGNFKLKWWNMIVEVCEKVWNRCTSKFNTMSRALNSVFCAIWWRHNKSNMADGRNFENRYISISQPRIVRIWRNLVADANFDPCDGNVRKFKKFPNARWRTDAILKIIFLAITRLHCSIKTKFGVRRLNCTLTKLGWWKCQISKIQHGGRPPFWKSL